MSILTPIAPNPAPAADPAPARNRFHRHDGWTPAAQRAFLEAIAEGVPVTAACRRVGLTHQSAYAFRNRASGASFALGWQAAALIGRNRIADELVGRALDGQVETITRPDGSVITRHRFDNRLAMHMLTRLDRLADHQVAEGTHHAARLVAQEFDAFLDLIDADEGPARAGLFVGLRVGGATDLTRSEMAPVVALARADRWCRTGAALADDVRIDDLDPAQRAHWTADQWARAEAAGLLVLAPPPDARAATSGDATGGHGGRNGNPQLMQRHGQDNGAEDAPGDADDRVWWDEYDDRWATDFPPPPDFDGEEDGRYGDDGYSRTLSEEEETALEAMHEVELAPLRAAEALARDIWFGFAATDGARHAAAVTRQQEGAQAGADACPADDPAGKSASDAHHRGECHDAAIGWGEAIEKAKPRRCNKGGSTAGGD